LKIATSKSFITLLQVAACSIADKLEQIPVAIDEIYWTTSLVHNSTCTLPAKLFEVQVLVPAKLSRSSFEVPAKLSPALVELYRHSTKNSTLKILRGSGETFAGTSKLDLAHVESTGMAVPRWAA
jgi:hypothetical protein